MTKSELFKAAHKLAKAYQVKFGGDYVVYLSVSLKKIITAAKTRASKEVLFSAINKVISKVSSDLPVITRTVKQSFTHGLKEFKAAYELEKAKKTLEAGQFFGKAFKQNGLVCAWVRSEKMVQEAY